MIRAALAASLPFLLVACEALPLGPAVPDPLKPPVGDALVTVVSARGVQVYECRPMKDNPAAMEWAFVAPEAELFDAQGRQVGKHYAGPHWEANDGSKVVGTVTASAPSPQPGAIPWLLLSTRSDGPAGTFSDVTSVQRLSTVGGVAPSEPCTSAGKTARVEYAAAYAMYGPRQAAGAMHPSMPSGSMGSGYRRY